MRKSVWSDGSNPVFMDPTFDEIVELAKSHPDTLRICDGGYDEGGHVALASGLGNTHDSVLKVARPVWGRYWSGADHILYKGDTLWWWNMEHINGRKAVSLDRGLIIVSPQCRQIVRDFVNVLGAL
jgi:hypothetical protein